MAWSVNTPPAVEIESMGFRLDSSRDGQRLTVVLTLDGPLAGQGERTVADLHLWSSSHDCQGTGPAVCRVSISNVLIVGIRAAPIQSVGRTRRLSLALAGKVAGASSRHIEPCIK